MASSSVELEDVPSVDIMTELLRRFKCSSKPDKRLVLIGTILLLFLFGKKKLKLYWGLKMVKFCFILYITRESLILHGFWFVGGFIGGFFFVKFAFFLSL